MALKLTKIDGLSLNDHWFLRAEDTCYHFGEYTARGGHSYSETNSLISNLKKPVDRRGRAEWSYKERDITFASRLIRSAFKPEAIGRFTFVPVPPSKAKNDPLYDDRMVRILTTGVPALDVREMVQQTSSTEASHHCAAGERPSIEQLAGLYEIVPNTLQPKPTQLVIVDDVLTTGRHFRAMSEVLSAALPGTPIIGMFIARVVHNAEFDFDEL